MRHHTNRYSELVRRGDIHPGVPHYGDNPITTSCSPAGPQQFGEDDQVWITYASEQERRFMIRPEAYDPPVGQSGLSLLGAYVNGLDADSF